MFMFVRCIRDFCECSIAGRREESLGEEHFTKHPAVRLNDAQRRQSLRTCKCNFAREHAKARGIAHGTFPSFVGTL
jgi:hypothetical protein